MKLRLGARSRAARASAEAFGGAFANRSRQQKRHHYDDASSLLSFIHFTIICYIRLLLNIFKVSFTH